MVTRRTGRPGRLGVHTDVRGGNECRARVLQVRSAAVTFLTTEYAEDTDKGSNAETQSRKDQTRHGQTANDIISRGCGWVLRARHRPRRGQPQRKGAKTQSRKERPEHAQRANGKREECKKASRMRPLLMAWRVWSARFSEAVPAVPAARIVTYAVVPMRKLACISRRTRM